MNSESTRSCWRRVRVVFLGAAVMSSIGIRAMADEAEEGAGLAEVTVTAERREESVQKVPISITAFTAADLQARQAPDLLSLSAAAPGLTIRRTTVGGVDLTIRGIGASGSTWNVDQAVGLYVDGVYYARTNESDVALVDMERVEVLRGPQGTLFGRNTIGGAISLTTAKPTDQFEGWAELEYGNFNDVAATAVVNVPVGSSTAIRAVVKHYQRDGYIDNSYLDDQFSNENYDYGRFSLLQKLGDRIRIDLSFDITRSRTDPPGYTLTYFNKGNPGLVSYLNHGFYQTFSGLNLPEVNDVKDAVGTVTWELPFATLKSITGFRSIGAELNYDLDASPLVIQDSPATDYNGHQTSEELQLLGKALDDRLSWITGVYYFNETMPRAVFSSGRAPTLVTYNALNAVTTSASGFAQATYQFLPSWRVTAGVRYVEDTRKATYNATSLSGTNCLIGASLRQNGCFYTPPEGRFHYPPWTVDLDYLAGDNTLVFAKVSQGYRSGGLPYTPSGSAPSAYAAFDQEKVMSSELGIKLELVDNHLHVTAGMFHSAYTNIQQQLNVIDPLTNGLVNVTRNVGDGHVNGGELETAALIGKLHLITGIAVADGTYTGGPQVGSKWVGTAPFTGSAAADYPLTLPFGELHLHTDYEYRAEAYKSPTVTPTGVPITGAANFAIKQPAYGLLNAKVSVDLNRFPVTLSAWINNATNKEYFTYVFNGTASGYNTAQPGIGRVYGATVRYNFR